MNQNTQVTLSSAGIHTGYALVGEYKIYLESGNCGQEVRFRVYETTQGQFEFEQSHHIKTPLQGGAYHTSVTHGDDKDKLLDRAVQTVVQWWDGAIKEGHAPTESWFEKNESY
jgi:hypothetical protein